MGRVEAYQALLGLKNTGPMDSPRPERAMSVRPLPVQLELVNPVTSGFLSLGFVKISH